MPHNWIVLVSSRARNVSGYIYSPALDVATVAARALLDRMDGGDVADGTKVRDIYNRQWSGLGTREEVTSALEVLEEHGWVHRETVKPEGGGRPSEIIRIHPELRE